MAQEVRIGIDIGGTNTALGVVSEEGEILFRDTFPTPRHGDARRYAHEIANAIKALLDKASGAYGGVELKGIGVCAPNANYYTGTIEHAPNLSFKGIVPLAELIGEEMNGRYAVALANDANAAALGEMVYGGAKGMKDFVVYTLGTGVGSGLVVGGRLVYGHTGFAGECGHTMLIPGGRLCGCGVRGHLEAYCSASGMKRTALEVISERNAADSPLCRKSYEEMTSKDIYDAAVLGDAVALEVFERTGCYLAQAMADTVHHTSPEAIFFFGGPAAAGEFILGPIRKHLKTFLLPQFQDKVKVLASALKSGDAAIVGAAAIVA